MVLREQPEKEPNITPPPARACYIPAAQKQTKSPEHGACVHPRSIDYQVGGEREDGFRVASAAESAQLLRLAEVEHILGAACLQLGIAAAAGTGGGVKRGSTPPAADATAVTAAAAASAATSDDGAGKMASPVIEASRPTVADTVVAAAGWRRPWGFGNGPFSEVSATKADIFVEGGSSGGAGDGGVDVDEQAIVAQLEVIWLSANACSILQRWLGVWVQPSERCIS